MDLAKFDKMPPVAVAMTPFPYFARVDDAIESVERLMREHAVRHIPVKDGARVVGLVSEPDLARAREAAGGTLQVREVATPDPYLVDLHAPLNEVLREMARRKVGSAIVVRDQKLAGILSVTDVCSLLAEVLEARFGGGGGRAA